MHVPPPHHHHGSHSSSSVLYRPHHHSFSLDQSNTLPARLSSLSSSHAQGSSSSSKQPTLPQAQQAAVEAAHRAALHAALYGPRPSMSGNSGQIGNASTRVYRSIDGKLSKADVAEGQPVQVAAPLDPALLASAAPWQADMMKAMAGNHGGSISGAGRDADTEAHRTILRLHSAPMHPNGSHQVQRPPVGYTTYCKERGMPVRQHASIPLIHAQQQLQSQISKAQNHASQAIQDLESQPVPTQPPLDIRMGGHAAVEAPQHPSQELREIILVAAAHAASAAEKAASAFRHYVAPLGSSSATSSMETGTSSAVQKAGPPTRFSSLYQVHQAQDPHAEQEQKDGYNKLLAHLSSSAPLAATATAAHEQREAKPSIVSAGDAAEPPCSTTGKAAPHTRSRDTHMTEATETSNDSAAATYWGSQERNSLEYESSEDGYLEAEGKHSAGVDDHVLRLRCVYEPTLYPDNTSATALSSANKLMQNLTIPGDVAYLPVRFESKLYALGVRFGFTAFSIALGSSYFQRLLAVMPQLEFAVRRCGAEYTDYLRCLPPCSRKHIDGLQATYGPYYNSPNHMSEEATLRSIQFTCIYLATKIVDRMPMMEMLRYILTHLYGSLVSKTQAYDVESKCLEGLKFRLGPFFVTDIMSDEDC